MNRSGFLLLATFAFLLALSLAVGVGSFVYATATTQGTPAFLPHLLLAVATFVGIAGLLIFVAGFVILGQRRLPGFETLAWVLLMLLFPVLGSGIFLLVSPVARHPAVTHP